MKKTTLNYIIKEVKKDGSCAFPFLKLTSSDLEYLNKHNILVDYTTINVNYLYTTQKRECYVLSLKK